MTLEEAIKARHSVRAYKAQPLAEDIVKVLEKEIEAQNRQGHLHIQLVKNEPKAFQGKLAKYGKFSNVTNYLVMAGQKAEDLDERSRLLAEMEACLYHSGIVEHHECSRWPMFGKRREGVFAHFAAPIEQQLGAIALGKRELGYALIGQRIVKLINGDVSCMFVHATKLQQAGRRTK